MSTQLTNHAISAIKLSNELVGYVYNDTLSHNVRLIVCKRDKLALSELESEAAIDLIRDKIHFMFAEICNQN